MLQVGEDAFGAASKGDKVVVKLGDEWQLPDELKPSSDGRPDARTGILQRLAPTRPPADEALGLLGKVSALKPGDGGAIVGQLSEDTAKELFMPELFMPPPPPARPGGPPGEGGERRGPPPPKSVKGSVQFWLRDGLLSKYTLKFEATVAPPDRDELQIGRTTTVQIHDIGKTKVEVPPEAKKKLSL